MLAVIARRYEDSRSSSSISPQQLTLMSSLRLPPPHPPHPKFQQDPKATVDVSVDWGGRTSSIKIITTPACLKFMWNRFVHLLGNVNRLTFHGDKPTSNVTPQVHRAAIRAVYIMVEIMLKSGQSLASTSLDISATMSGRFAISAIASPPSTNTILDIYGAWLFDAALQQKEGYESGR